MGPGLRRGDAINVVHPIALDQRPLSNHCTNTPYHPYRTRQRGRKSANLLSVGGDTHNRILKPSDHRNCHCDDRFCNLGSQDCRSFTEEVTTGGGRTTIRLPNEKRTRRYHNAPSSRRRNITDISASTSVRQTTSFVKLSRSSFSEQFCTRSPFRSIMPRYQS